MTFAIKNGLERLANHKNENVTKGDVVALLIDAVAYIALVTFAVLAMRQAIPLQQRAIIALFGSAALLIVLDVLTLLHKKGEKHGLPVEASQTPVAAPPKKDIFAGLPKLRAKHMPTIGRTIYAFKAVFGLKLIENSPLNRDFYEISVTTHGHIYMTDIKKHTISEWEYPGEFWNAQGHPYTGVKRSKNHPGEGYPDAKPQYSIETLSLEESTSLVNGLKTYLENATWRIKAETMERYGKEDGFLHGSMREGLTALKVDPQTRIIDFSKSFWLTYGWYYIDNEDKKNNVQTYADIPDEYRSKACVNDANKRPITNEELERVQEQLDENGLCD